MSGLVGTSRLNSILYITAALVIHRSYLLLLHLDCSLQIGFDVAVKMMESKDKASVRYGRSNICSPLFIAFTVILQVVFFVCLIFIVVPYQVDTNNRQMRELFDKFDKEQAELRSEINQIKKSFDNETNLHHSRMKRSPMHTTHNTRLMLQNILRKLNKLAAAVKDRPKIWPIVRGPPGPPGPPGEKGKKGDKGSNGASTNGGTTFVRWGRKTCPSTSGTTKVYDGRIGGQHYTHHGGTSSQLCLSLNPKFASRDYGNTGQYIYGTEYEVSGGNPFTKKIHDHDAICVVCRVSSRGSTLVVNGRNDCPAGWTLEYHGYLMSEHYGHKGRTEAICVDINAGYGVGTHHNHNGNLLYTLQGACGSLPCLPYISGREITCAVCTK